ncbi:PSV family class A beta-lactamase [Pseudovibrio sp. POLY-S9]|uniref:PSV family class A beta-lactamase n=1 Tax=Pseudovibrio sp. POLY-S9 TaxID=1576596 RepID=UPI000A4CE130|nr:PSV family class A beta-lactamase [Pseudovibrio sp. POLY-S9]
MLRFLEENCVPMRRFACALAFTLSLPLVSEAGPLMDTVSQLETEVGGRIGVVLRHTGSDWAVEHRADERFPMASTFKALLCGAVLSRVDRGEESLGDLVTYKATELVPYSPVTENHVASGMSVGQLCEATVTMSDNSAANLLLKRVDGPEGLTRFLRGLGDRVTRLDRNEPAMNEARRGDPRDTTSPSAVLKTLDRLLFEDVLLPSSRAQLQQWMVDDKVADELIRKHLPKDWRIADKSGAGYNGSRGIIAVLWPETGKPYLAAAYMSGSDASFKQRNAVIAEIGKAMIEEIKQR